MALNVTATVYLQNGIYSIATCTIFRTSSWCTQRDHRVSIQNEVFMNTYIWPYDCETGPYNDNAINGRKVAEAHLTPGW